MGMIEQKISYMEAAATKAEKKIIDNLKKISEEELIYMSITELAERLGSAEATFLRFCKKIGLKGYQEFKLLLSRDLTRRETQDDKGMADRIAEDMIYAINSTRELILPAAVRQAATLITSARNVHIFGVGNSGLAALEAKNRLLRAGFYVNASTDSHFQSVFCSQTGPDEVVVLISISGSTKDIIECAELAKENGAKIIAVTNNFKTPLSRHADLCLYSVRKEAPAEGGSLVTKISQLYILDVLCAAIIEELGLKAEDSLKKSADSLASKLV